MELKEFISRLNKAHFSLTAENGKLNLAGDKSKLSESDIVAIRNNHEVINYIKENKSQLLEYLSNNSNFSSSKKTKDISSIYRLSGLQEGMLFHALYDQQGEAYVGQFSCDVTNVDLAIFTKAWNYVLQNHSILRSAFYYDAFNIPVQSVKKEVSLSVETVDFSSFNNIEQADAIKKYEAADRLKSFDFKKPPLIRFSFIRLDEKRYRMLWTFHHIVFDGWSLPILMEEFLNTYELLLAGKPPKLKEEDLYEDYIRYIDRKDKSKAEQYWKNYMKGVQQSTLLPFINSSSERTKGGGFYKSISLEIDKATTDEIQLFARDNRVTINTIVQAVWSYLLHSYTSNNNVVYGVIVSGRPDDLPGVEKRVGMYINTLPLHSSIDEKINIKEWMQQLQNDQVQSRECQYSALHEIQRLTGVQGDLFDSLLVFENYPVSKIIGQQQWSLQFENVTMNEQTNYPLTIIVNSADQINIRFSYNADLLEESYVLEIKDHFKNVLFQITKGAANDIDQLKLLSPARELELLQANDNTNVSFPLEKTIIDLFEEQVASTPDNIAVTYNGSEISYKQLNEKANQLAAFLQKKGVTKETFVPICIDRSAAMIVGIMGILKAGGAYVPIDPGYPDDRINFMLDDIAATLILTNEENKTRLSTHLEVIVIDEAQSLFATEPITNLAKIAEPNNVAYIIYTSGSTGKPKGVMVEHQNVVRLFKTDSPLFDFNEKDVWTLFHSFSFDFSVWEIFGALLFGGKLVVVPKDTTKDVALFAQLLLDEKVTVLNQTPSAFYVLQDQLVDKVNDLPIRVVIFGGEALNPAKLRAWKQAFSACTLVNMYGITETTVHVTYQQITAKEIESSNSIIGKPIPTLSCLVLNADKKVVPVGIPGELYVGGAGVARGYLNRAELSAERFIQNPFANDHSPRLYKTGDLARLLPNSDLEYLGRIDEQVKIRGFRIELGEIESVVQQSGLVRQNVVVAKEDNTGNKRLIGYIVPDENFNQELLIEHLRDKLPDYMVPAFWVQLTVMPLTSNGKVDKKALPAADVSAQLKKEFVAPRNETEQKLADIWQELLGIDKVGINDNFFELGGHSILAMQVVSSIRRKLKLEVGIKDLFVHPTIKDISESLLGYQQTSSPGITKADPTPENIPLSFGQERLWFIDKLEGSVAYHISAAFRLKGNLNKEALQFALQTIVKRHEVLRTVIIEQEEEAFQQVIDFSGWKLQFAEVSVNSIINDFSQQLQQLANKPFDLSKDYMLRAHLITCDVDDHVLLVTMHHIASDGWSLSIVVKEVVELYRSYIENTQPNLDALTVQYADYAIWQRNVLQGEELDKKINYWKQQLAGVAPLQLPTDFPRPAVQTTKGDTAVFAIDKELLLQIQSFNQQQGATLFMTLLAAFKVLLYRYTGQHDICVGTPTANRTYKEVENLVGLFLNTLALRTNVDASNSFIDLLQQVKATTLAAYEHQDVPFEKVVEAVVKERDISRNALFQVMFTLQNTPDVPEIKLGDVALSSEAFSNQTSKFDVSFSLTENAVGIHGSVLYNADLFAKETVERMCEHFIELLSRIVKAPTQKIDVLPIIPPKQSFQILNVFNKPVQSNLLKTTLFDLFEEQVAATPNNIALVFGDEKLTYQQLNERANQLANYLVSEGVQQETIVPICIDRSPEMMIGILAILKAGGAYVPVDPGYPSERIKYIFDDTNATIILTSKQHFGKIKAITKERKIVAIDDLTNTISSNNKENLNHSVGPDQLAYVLYTSGSTGTPKGVQVEHHSIAGHLQWFTKQYNITANDSSLLVSSFSFDGALTAIWPVLVKGGTLHLPTNDLFDPAEVIDYVSEHAVTYIKTLPSIFKEIVHADNFGNSSLQSLRLVILGGEKINENDIKAYFSVYPNVLFSNHYGPTECTVSSSFYLINEENIDTIKQRSIVGKPIDNTLIYVLSQAGSLNPVGVPGEIVIGGFGVARGYLNSEELTKQKFVADTFNPANDARMYKTGDLGKWLPDGNLEFIGRKDEQVKVRGYRIELGEIENVLRQSSLVKEAVVVAKEDSSGNNNLIAYVVPHTGNSKGRILAFLKEQLPGFMIPAVLVEMESLPLSPNGKVDKKALPQPGEFNQSKENYQAPRNRTEKVITNIWQELLKKERIGIHDNFFQIGGHSLLAIRVASAIRKQLKVEVSIKSLFLYPTIETLAGHIRLQEKGILLPTIEPQSRSEKIPLSFSQERLWFIDRMEGSVQYHIPSVLRLKGNVNIDALGKALQTVVARHEVLRTVIKEEKGRGYQIILEKKPFQFEVINAEEYKNDRQKLEQFILQLIKKPFDLSADLMVRASLISLANNEYLLVIVMHHIASDRWSTSIFVDEVVSLYQAHIQQRGATLPALKIQYADYAIWQRNYLQGEVYDNKVNYWKQKLNNVTPLDLPADFSRPAVSGNKGSIVSFSIDKKLTEKLNALSQQQDVTLFMTLLAAFKVLLFKYTGQQDVCIGSPVAGRMQEEVEHLIGFFINTLALRTQLDEAASFTANLAQVKETALEAFEHQDVPFEKVVEAVVEERDLGRKPIFQVMFVLQNAPDVEAVSLTDMAISSEAPPHHTAMFDLTISVTETKEGLKGGIEFSTDLFAEDSIKRMIEYFVRLLTSIVEEPETAIEKLSIITQEQEKLLLQEFNDNQFKPVIETNVVALLETQVEKSPNNLAVVFKDQQLTYTQLNEKANELAHHLIASGVREEMLVPIFLNRSLDMVIAIFAILKAGASYVPIDPNYPTERINFIISDVAANIVLTNGENLQKLPKKDVLNIVEVDEFLTSSTSKNIGNLSSQIKKNNLAYVIYTSGSTGTPKGVMIEHGSLMNYLVNNKTKYINDDNCTGSFVHLSYTFDASVTALFMPLIAGKSIVVGSTEQTEIFADENLWKYAPFDFIKLTPAHLPLIQEIFVKAGKKITSKLVVGGEALTRKHLNYFISKNIDVEVINEYGPTEATVGCSTYSVHTAATSQLAKESIPIGKPIDGVQMFVLDRTLGLCPIGVPGEMYISGEGLARGYWNRAELTAEKFVLNPFSKVEGERLYKTGDVGKWLADGNLEYLGRTDSQVKIRGFRVELQEIEHVVQQSGLVNQSIVVVKELSAGNKRLVAYVVPAEGFDEERMTAFLKDRLPAYMLPSFWVAIDKIPLTTNGKVDVKALPAVQTELAGGQQYVAPVTETEQMLVTIWEELLGVTPVGIEDNFFKLGGHSLMVMQLKSAIHAALKVELEIKDLFQYPTVKELGKFISIQSAAGGEQNDDDEFDLLVI